MWTARACDVVCLMIELPRRHTTRLNILFRITRHSRTVTRICFWTLVFTMSTAVVVSVGVGDGVVGERILSGACCTANTARAHAHRLRLPVSY